MTSERLQKLEADLRTAVAEKRAAGWDLQPHGLCLPNFSGPGGTCCLLGAAVSPHYIEKMLRFQAVDGYEVARIALGLNPVEVVAVFEGFDGVRCTGDADVYELAKRLRRELYDAPKLNAHPFAGDYQI